MKMKLFLLLLIALFTAYISGCGPIKKPLDTTEPVLQEPPPAPSLNIRSIDIRCDYLKTLIKNEDLNHEERAALNALLNAYNSVKIFLSNQLTNSQQAKIIRDLFNSIAILDYRYFSKRHTDVSEENLGNVPILVAKRKEILERFIADDFKAVISRCIELEQDFGKEGFDHEINLVFILSLGEEGRLTEAVNLGEDILRQSEALPDLMYLKSKVVEWNLTLGNGEEALNLYDKMTDELDSKTSLIKSLRKKIIELDSSNALTNGTGGTGNTVSPQENREEKSFQDILKEANDLAQKREFNKAKLLLATQKNKAKSPSEIDLIERSIKLIELAEQESKDQVISQENRQKEIIDLVRKWIEKDDYEKAIVKIDELAAEGALSLELQELREEAVEKFVNKERNRAASLFLSAKNAKEPDEKRKYLIESRGILQAIINRFPTSKLNERLKSHLNAIENELEKL